MYPVIHIFHLEIATFVLFLLLASIVATFLLRHELIRNGYPRFLYVELMTIGLLTGLIGSRTYYILENWKEFVQDPSAFIISLSGWGWYGGFILAGISIILAIRIGRLPVLMTLDILIPIVPLAHAIGKMGCFFAGCCQGVPSNLLWAVSFSDGSFPANVRVHPTQLYEMLIYLAIFFLLWKQRASNMRPGKKVALYLILSGLGRFICEFCRLNLRVFYGLTAPQLFSITAIIMGTSILILSRNEAVIRPSRS